MHSSSTSRISKKAAVSAGLLSDALGGALWKMVAKQDSALQGLCLVELLPQSANAAGARGNKDVRSGALARSASAWQSSRRRGSLGE